jgi:hypothetical protein
MEYHLVEIWDFGETTAMGYGVQRLNIGILGFFMIMRIGPHLAQNLMSRPFKRFMNMTF